MGKRSTAIAVLALAWLAAQPAADARAIALEPDRWCYGPHQQIDLTGYGYTPDGGVRLSLGGVPLGLGYADYDGVFSAVVRTPALSFGIAWLRFTATDQTYRLNRAGATVRVVRPRVALTPRTGAPARRQRVRARGFFDGRVLYAHVRRDGRARRTVRLGRLRGACRRLDVRRRLVGPRAPAGRYAIHFDTSPRDAGARRPRVSYGVRIGPPAQSSTAGNRSRRWSASAARTASRSGGEAIR